MKKSIVFKTIAIVGMLGIVFVIPSILASCSLVYQKNQNGNSNNDSPSQNGSNGSINNQPNIPTNPDQPPNGDSTQKPTHDNENIEPIFNDYIVITDNINNLYTYGSKESVDDNINLNITKYINQNPSLVLKNYNLLSNQQKNNINFLYTGNYPGDSQFGNIPYQKWSVGKIDNTNNFVNLTKITYNVLNMPFKFIVNSFDEFKKELDSFKLQKMFEQMLETTSLNNTYKIVENCALGYTNGLLHINVASIENNNNDIKYYDLQIPISNMVLLLKGSLQTNVNNIKTTINNFNIRYQLSIDSNIKTAFEPIDFSNENQINTLNVAKYLKWYSNIPNDFEDDSLVNNLNSVKMGDDLGMYNVHFSQLSLIKVVDGVYNLKFYAQPNKNFFWNDTKNDNPRFLEYYNLKINVKDAYSNSQTNSSPDVAWGIEKENILDFYKSNIVLESKTSAAATNFFNNQVFLNKFANFVQFQWPSYYKNIYFTFADAVFYDQILNEGSSGTVVLKVNIAPIPGHIFEYDNKANNYGYFAFKYIEIKK